MKCFSLSCIRPDFQLEISGRETESDQFYFCFLLLFSFVFGGLMLWVLRVEGKEAQGKKKCALTDKNWNQVC